MELHNYLFGAWYLINLLEVFVIVHRGYFRYTLSSLIISTVVYVGLTASLIATGDADSLRAIFFYCWWTWSLFLGVMNYDDEVEIDESAGAFAALISIILGAVGLTMP